MNRILHTAAWLLALHTALFAQTDAALRLHPQNPHYFFYENKPTVLVGSGEHYGAVVNLDFDYKKYLQTLAQDGLNTTRLFAGAYVEKLGDFGIQRNTLAPAAGRLILPWRRSPVPGYALGGAKFDLLQWDEAYFARLKDFMAEAARNGVVVEVTLFSSHYSGGWNYSAFNRANNVNGTDSIPAIAVQTLRNGNILSHQERYVRKMVRELNAFGNLYFEIQNEPWADLSDTVLIRNAYGPADDWRSTIQVVAQSSNAWQRQVARWIVDEEKGLANKHLISQNISNFRYPITDADPVVSIFNFHYSLPEAVAENYHLNKVIGFNETGFAGRSDTTYRRQAWRFLMAGGALFNHLDYSFSVGAEDGQDTAYTAPGGGSPALRRQLGIMKRFFDKQNLTQLQPDPTVVAAAPGATTAALRNGPSQWIIYYEPMTGNTADIKLRLPVGRYKAAWMDVATGNILASPVVSGERIAVPAGGSDKVLTLSALSTK